MIRKFDVVVFGDLNLDHSVTNALPFAWADLVENGRVNWAPIDVTAGGTAYNFADRALRFGLSPQIVGAVGSDLAGKQLVNALNHSGIGACITVSENKSTGMAIIVRDARDVRFINDNAPNANSDLGQIALQGLQENFGGYKFAFISGYSLIDRASSRFGIVVRAMELLRRAAVPVVLDVVPHRMYEYFEHSEFWKLVGKISVLFSEVSTIRPFLQMGDREEVVDYDVAWATAVALAERIDKFVLRYGKSGTDFELIGNLGELVFRENNVHATLTVVRKIGYGDELTLEVLKDHFNLF